MHASWALCISVLCYAMIPPAQGYFVCVFFFKCPEGDALKKYPMVQFHSASVLFSLNRSAFSVQPHILFIASLKEWCRGRILIDAVFESVSIFLFGICDNWGKSNIKMIKIDPFNLWHLLFLSIHRTWMPVQRKDRATAATTSIMNLLSLNGSLQ